MSRPVNKSTNLSEASKENRNVAITTATVETISTCIVIPESQFQYTVQSIKYKLFSGFRRVEYDDVIFTSE